ncbi:MAG: hypothetical protein [Arizlama microvirus]|nr:MAG: hypothetical protein [Arizlama microvirus]
MKPELLEAIINLFVMIVTLGHKKRRPKKPPEDTEE